MSLVLATLTSACGVGGVEGGDDDDDDDTTPVDAGPDPVLCATKFRGASGDVTHDTAPAGSCDGGGGWTVTLSEPGADEDGHDECDGAPAEQTFNFTVTVLERDEESGAPLGYAVADDDDGEREWSVSISDKSGSCSGSFSVTLAGGIEWAMHATEDGADGALGGQGSYQELDESL
jgi:hypothetical protein